MINNPLTFLLLRLGMGASLLGHGLVRLPKLAGFSNWMTTLFSHSMIPKLLVLPFSYLLPIAEFLIGTMLVLGLLTKQALLAGSIVMLILIFGSCMIEEWSALPSQVIHLFILSALLSQLPLNSFATDHLFNKK